MDFITVWSQDFRKAERISTSAAQVLYEQGVIRAAFKPNNKGTKLKSVWVSIDLLSRIRDTSCQMGPRVIEGNAAGNRRYQSIVQEWGRDRIAFV